MASRLKDPGGTTLVNVLGSGGSGTTLLALMLGNSERGFTPGETRVWYRPHQPAHFGFACWCRRNPCPVWEQIGVFPEGEVYRRAAEVLGAEVIADSSKWIDWARDAGEWARNDGMRVSNVLIWRDPIDLVHSWWRRGRLGGGKAEALEGEALRSRALTELGKRFIDYTELLFEGGFDPLVVSYDRLVEDPAGILSNLCTRIGIDYRPGQERFWEGDHHTLFGNESARHTIEAGEAGELKPVPPAAEFKRAAAELIEGIATERPLQETVQRLRAASIEPS